MRWQVRWEHELTEADHEEIATLIRTTFADTFPEWSRLHQGCHSWGGSRPELRITAHDDIGLVAHLSMLRRFVRVGAAEQLVAEIGQVTVRGDMRRSGVGREVGVHLNAVLHELKVPFAFGVVGADVLPFYSATGSHVLEATVMTFDALRPWTSQVDQGVAVITPIAATVDQWPPGEVIHRNGAEL